MRDTTPHARLPLAAAAALALALLAAGPTLAQPPAAVPGLPATSSPPSLDQLLRDLASWDGGIDSAASWKVRDYVYARRDDEAGRAACEAKLLLFLKGKATVPARMAAARLLRAIAADSAVPALQALLADDRSADLALYVLQPMPGAAADQAILQGVSSTKGATRLALIAAAGMRQMPAAVPVLSKLLTQPETAKAAAIALGTIGDGAAADALSAASAEAPASLKPALASARLRCAERALAAGNTTRALPAYEALWADRDLPAPIRTAAALGRVSASGPRATETLLELLRGGDPGVQLAAIGRVREVVGPEAVAPFCALLPSLPEPSQVALLAALAGFPRERVLPAVTQAARSDAPAVRLAALGALTTVGDASTVPMLLDLAAKSRGAEQAAARAALAGLKGRAVDEALLSALGAKPDAGAEVELLMAVAERRVYPAKPAVAASLSSASPRVRAQALRSLRAIGTPSDIQAVIDLLLKAVDDESVRADAEGTISALAQKVSRADQRAREVKARLAEEKDGAVRARLFGLLPLVGDASALPLLRAALADDDPAVRDAAVRAIAAWPSAVARDDLFRLARDSRDETHRLLAIQGLVRVVGADRYRDPQAAVADLRLAAGFAWRPEERRLVLGALGQFPCGEALELARGFLADPAVKAEAQAAVQRIGKALK